MSTNTFTRPSALAPLAMSLAALAVVLARVAVVGPARQVVEGAAAHLFRLLVAGELPVVVYFAIKWLGRKPKEGLAVPTSQAMAAMAAFAPVWDFNL